LTAIAGTDRSKYLLFDSSFESANLDLAVQVDHNEFDLYMRVDSNTRGHHQWFYFKINNQQRTGTVKFNIVNFTKKQSLYMHGMRVNTRSKLDTIDRREKVHEARIAERKEEASKKAEQRDKDQERINSRERIGMRSEKSIRTHAGGAASNLGSRD